MTSVRSRPQLSNGSKLLFFLFIAFIAACTSQKGLKDGASGDKGVRVYNPKTGTYELVENPESLVDTIDWTEKADVPDPIGPIDESPKGFKDVYNLTYLMPFNANGQSFGNTIDAKTRRFLNYYGGVKLALEDLRREGVNLNVEILDTKESADVVRMLMEENNETDVFIGPYQRDALQVAATFAEEKDVPVISPWTPTIIPDVPGSNFFQVVPGLETHAEAAMRFTGRVYPNARYLLVATPETEDHSRMQIYNEAFEASHSGQEPLEMLVIDDAALSPDSNALTSIYDSSLTYVFFMPFFLRSEEAFVNSFLRKVHAEHGATEVVIMGLPQWMSYTSIDPDYLESLNTHITAFQFVDNSEPDVREFNRRYYNTYGGVPEVAARRGYDLTMYVGRKLSEHGTAFVDEVFDEYDRDFRFRPVDLTGDIPEPPRPAYIENKGIAILIFENQQFRRLE